MAWGKGKGKGKAAQFALGNGPSKGGGTSKGGGRGGYDPIEAEAIREIKEQLRDPNNVEGFVWVEGWAPRFADHLGGLREFLESRPDKFQVIPGAGRKYTVALPDTRGDYGAKNQGHIVKASPKNQGRIVKGSPGANAPWRMDSAAQCSAAAAQEITEQLKAQGGAGNVWVDQWGQRFEDSLGSIRDFLESQPDKFTVYSEGGRRYSVELVKRGRKRGSQDYSGVIAPVKKQKGGKSKGNGKAGGWNPLVAEAVREIKEQIREPSSDGRVWVYQWGPRFEQELGTLREFLENMPEKFVVIPGEGRKFTVDLA